MRINRATYICFAVVSLLAGSAIYILFRPPSLLMFQWTNALGLLPLTKAMRFYAHGMEAFLPAWFVYSLPFALWIISYLFFIRAIWLEGKCFSRILWFWLIPLVSIAAELGQCPRLVPGTFDLFDLLTIAVATALVYIVTTLDHPSPRKETT